MRRYIAKILVLIMIFSNIAPQVAYAAGESVSSGAWAAEKPKVQKANTTKEPVGALSSNLISSASILSLGTSDATDRSANKKIGVSVQKLQKKDFKADEEITLILNNPDREAYQTKVTDADGKEADVELQQDVEGATTELQIIPGNQFKPGKYTVSITGSDGKTTKQNFTWGVLALNPDKAIYKPQETSEIAMAVLDEKGAMVCDASVNLEIKNQELGINDTLSTSNGKIRVNSQCNSHEFSLEPDYETSYQLGGVGTYELTLSAQTPNGRHTITDVIAVKDYTPFEIKRTSATRIYPPNDYPMQLEITANRDFKGIITETVPQSFEITPNEDKPGYQDMQTVYLEGSKNPESVLGANTGGLVMPFQGNFQVTQGFGTSLTDLSLREFYSHYGLAGHDGIDFGLPMGTPLFAVDEGDVVWAGPGDYGTQVIIQHRWGKSYYGHMSKTTVEKGYHVNKGSQIGYSGNTGESTGPHLHFGMKPESPDMQNGFSGKVDPMTYLPIGKGANAASALGLNSISAVLSASDAADASPSGEAVSVTPTLAPTSAPQAAPKDSVGFSVENDEIPSEIASDQSDATEKVKVLKWQVDVKKGDKINLSYKYKTPQVSPQFYLMGPVKFFEGDALKNDLLFDEGRQWQIAADDMGDAWYHPSTNPNSGYEWKYRKKISIDHNLVGNKTAPTADATNNTTATDTGTVSSLSWSHTTGGNSNRFLMVAVAPSSNQTVNAITYAGVSMSRLTSTLYSSSTRNLEVWYMVAPTTGANSVNVTLDGNSAGVRGYSMSYYNVDQERPYGSPQGNAGEPFTDNATASNFGATITAYDSPYQLMVGGFAKSQTGGTFSTTNGTQHVNSLNATTGIIFGLADTPGLGGSTTLSWSASNSTAGGEYAFALNGAASSSNIANYPIAINTTDSDLQSRAQSDGDDIVFAYPNGTKTPHEIESYNATTGRLIAWVNIANLTVNTDAEVYMYYGNPTAINQQDAANLWDANYLGVWHLKENPASTCSGSNEYCDSTSNANHANETGTILQQDAVVWKGADFDGSSSYASVPNFSSQIAGLTTMTIEGWIFPLNNPGAFEGYFGMRDNLAEFYIVQITGTNNLECRLTRPPFNAYNTTATVVNNTWNHVALVYDGSTLRCYVNGVSGASVAASGSISNTTVPFRIGSDGPSSNNHGNVSADEVRFSNVARSGDWIATDFVSQSLHDLFSMEGTQEETKIYAPTNEMLMRHGKFFDSGANAYGKQPFVF